MPKFCIILLAAGASSRMESPKPLLPWGDFTLIEDRILRFQKTGYPLLVVLGAHAERILPIVQKYPIKTVVNPHWKEGMGRSIAFAAKTLKNTEPLYGILITTVDQPLVDEQHIQAMIKTFEPEQQQIIVSVSSDQWKGVPVLFDPSYLDALGDLQGDLGAKEIVRLHQARVKPCMAGDKLVDMDTPESYHQLYQAIHQS